MRDISGLYEHRRKKCQKFKIWPFLTPIRILKLDNFKIKKKFFFQKHKVWAISPINIVEIGQKVKKLWRIKNKYQKTAKKCTILLVTKHFCMIYIYTSLIESLAPPLNPTLNNFFQHQGGGGLIFLNWDPSLKLLLRTLLGIILSWKNFVLRLVTKMV